MQIDIRSEVESKVTSIIFSDALGSLDAKELYLCDSCTEIRSNDSFVHIDSQEDALNLIKALQKAIKLGNWNDND